MNDPGEFFDAVIIGGGFFGCCLALHLRQRHARVLVLEKEPALLKRASYSNQARIHAGYHYPRSLLTAARSWANLPRFVEDFRDGTVRTFAKLYAIARNNSKVTARQFETVFRRIGAPVEPASEQLRSLFDFQHVEDVFLVQEYAFDASKLRQILNTRMAEAGIEVRLETIVQSVAPCEDGVEILLDNGQHLRSHQVFNCTYSQINSLLKRSGLPLLGFKHELAEIALVKVPDELKNVGITVMDGMFFSTMPFPAEGLHSLSHVRYTPHMDWQDRTDYHDPELRLRTAIGGSNFPFMVRDAMRFVPSLRQGEYVRSLYEVKTVLVQNEVDDGRPILFRRDYGITGFHVVMGGKLDNIYDVLQAIDAGNPANPVGVSAD